MRGGARGGCSLRCEAASAAHAPAVRCSRHTAHAAARAHSPARAPRAPQVKCHACVGGTSVREDARILSSGVHVVVGTPGRVYDMLRRRCLRADSIKMFVLDEADEMLSRGFKDQIYDIFQLLPPKLQVRAHGAREGAAGRAGLPACTLCALGARPACAHARTHARTCSWHIGACTHGACAPPRAPARGARRWACSPPRCPPRRWRSRASS